MSEVFQPLVSIIVPTYNEEADIGRTMDALAELIYRPIEVIVVDASMDRTPEIVLSYEGRVPGLKLVSQGDKPGVSSARNIGLREANGEIVVILNADVFPPPDFIDQIIPYYRGGADYLLVDSEVLNTDKLYPRYIQAQHEYNLMLNRDELQWTEGFSCRREAALAVGGFPEEFAKNTAGEDAIFGKRLHERYQRAVDFSIVVPHVMPTALSEYWQQRLGRGRGGAYVLYVDEKRPMSRLAIARSVLGMLFLAGIMFPPLIYASRLVLYSPRGMRDWLPFAWARMIEMVATAVGYWYGCREIESSRRS